MKEHPFLLLTMQSWNNEKCGCILEHVGSQQDKSPNPNAITVEDLKKVNMRTMI